MNLVVKTKHSVWLLTQALFLWGGAFLHAEPSVQLRPDGELVYTRDQLGNSIPDFSTCGYASNERTPPVAVPKVFVSPSGGDDTPQIQAAIDFVADLQPSKEGIRGAVFLAPGEFRIAGQLVIRQSGVVLRGCGATPDGTTLIATGLDRRPLICVLGSGSRELSSTGPRTISSPFVPVGANTFQVDRSDEFAVGDQILVTRPSTLKWIDLLKARAPGVGWRPGSRDLDWERRIVAIEENEITLDAPITTAIDQEFGGGIVQAFSWPSRLQNVGIEDLRLVSEVINEDLKDEDHAWFGVVIDKACDCWVRKISFSQFAGGAVSLGRFTSHVTVEDCISDSPISELGGYRRHTFFNLGQLNLFYRCSSEEGIHDFCTGHCSPGPNVFLYCRAERAHGESGPLESWSAGVLYDNVRIDGSDLIFENRWANPGGAGWSAANCVSWQCRAANLRCFQPPGANNWAIGAWATPAGDGVFESLSDIVNPFSLFQAQVRQRLGDEVAARYRIELGHAKAATNPTYVESARFLKESELPARTLRQLIEQTLGDSQDNRQQEFAALGKKNLKNASDLKVAASIEATKLSVLQRRPVEVVNGWLTKDGKLITGKRYSPSWWRGSLRGVEPLRFGHNITRFAPGRFGVGVTEEVGEIVEDLAANGFASYSHHYGLWYDRRRDDHLMARRADGEVVPPFYEQPFARSGQGTAWDGLSKYDLTKPNPWYWSRLGKFAELAESRRMILLNHHYFQHNILEAGAHWADSPWRPANNTNDDGLPEPPPYIGDKRLFMAQHFYDPTNKRLRELHRQYIRQCLKAFRTSSNVLHLTSAEYTGPLEFTQFWLDTVADWEREQKVEVLLTLSCTKDVQDAILQDAVRARSVDVIDISYWTYDKNMQLYAPEGGKYLAPRQHMRQLNPKESSFTSIVHAVSECREKYPAKPVIYTAEDNCRTPNDGWAVLLGGGSLADVKLPEKLQREILAMRPSPASSDDSDHWVLKSPRGEMLAYYSNPREKVVLPSCPFEQAELMWIDPVSGAVIAQESVDATAELKLTPKSKVLWLRATSE